MLTPRFPFLLSIGAFSFFFGVTAHMLNFRRLEFYSPPYMSRPRPTYSGLPKTVDYNSTFELKVDLPKNVKSVTGKTQNFCDKCLQLVR